LKKLSPAEKAWATRRANQQKKAQKRGGGTRRGHRGKRGPHPRDFGKLRPAAGFRKLKSGKRRGEVFPVFDPSKLTPGQKAWDTRRKKHGKTGLSKSHRAKTKPKKPTEIYLLMEIRLLILKRRLRWLLWFHRILSLWVV